MSSVTAIPFNDLGRGVAALRSELDAALARVLDSGWFVLGGEGRAFEEEFAASLGVDHAVGVASGTDAIELALRALELGPGDEVVTQANTCVPTVSAIERAGATPVLCDVEPEAGTMDLDSLRGALWRADASGGPGSPLRPMCGRGRDSRALPSREASP